MKICLNSDELDDLEQRSDSEIAELVRGSLKRFRNKGGTEAEDAEDPPADPSGAGHGGRSTNTLETSTSRGANRNPGARDSAIAATQAAAARVFDERIRQDERDAEAETIIKGYRRL